MKIAIVGAGHNALVCACYLAKAGHEVSVFERASHVGGAVHTEELWPGYRIDTCSVMHILIHKTPIIQELQLHTFGLEYIQIDPVALAPFPDGSSITFWRDLDRTCQSLARISERDADAYREFVQKWDRFNQPVFELFTHAPSPGAVVGKIARRTIPSILDFGFWILDYLKRNPTRNPKPKIRVPSGRLKSDMGGLQLLSRVLGSYGKMLDETFVSPQVKAAIGWLAAQSGP